jgi:hypothetical protein
MYERIVFLSAVLPAIEFMVLWSVVSLLLVSFVSHKFLTAVNEHQDL